MFLTTWISILTNRDRIYTVRMGDKYLTFRGRKIKRFKIDNEYHNRAVLYRRTDGSYLVNIWDTWPYKRDYIVRMAPNMKVLYETGMARGSSTWLKICEYIKPPITSIDIDQAGLYHEDEVEKFFRETEKGLETAQVSDAAKYAHAY